MLEVASHDYIGGVVLTFHSATKSINTTRLHVFTFTDGIVIETKTYRFLVSDGFRTIEVKFFNFCSIIIVSLFHIYYIIIFKRDYKQTESLS